MCKPGLFGLKRSNRDFTIEDSWGKNQFNSSFPAALCCYLESRGLSANYVTVDNDGNSEVTEIPISDLFGIPPTSDHIFFAFESGYSPYQKYVIGNLPRTDLVIQRTNDNSSLRALEIKLTALPDNTTCKKMSNKYGAEIVIRPDTIVYLACSLIDSGSIDFDIDLHEEKIKIDDWSDPCEVIQNINEIVKTIENISTKTAKMQIPFLLQPVWKTDGKSSSLSTECLDVFAWSSSAFCNYVTKISNRDSSAIKINRPTRTVAWIYKMLLEYKEKGHFNHEGIIDDLSYNTKNDKAFASSGTITNPFMACANLTKPRINKDEIKNIILGGGQSLLSPERRFDAIIYNSPELFD